MAGVGVYGARLPGRESRLSEKAHETVDAAANELADAVKSLSETSQLILFGQCSGALIAFELARELRRRRRSVAHLYVVGLEAPQLVADRRASTHQEQTVEESLRAVGEVDQKIWDSPELRKIVISVATADFQFLKRYRYCSERPLEAPITAFLGVDDPTPVDSVRAWKPQTCATFELESVAGGHFPSWETMVAKIKINSDSQISDE